MHEVAGVVLAAGAAVCFDGAVAWQAHLGYAETLREIGQCRRAIPEYEATLRLQADQPQAIAGLRSCRP